MAPENRSPTIADPFLASELEQKQERVRTVYKRARIDADAEEATPEALQAAANEGLPSNAPDGTIVNLDTGDKCYQCTRMEGKWFYQPLYASIEDINA